MNEPSLHLLNTTFNKWMQFFITGSLLFIVLGIISFAYAGDSTTSALSFTPPSTDASMKLLSAIFGTVGGVLKGSGSEIMGAMFKIFNGAVLLVGGIIIIYTILVGTLRTAHEGEMLGQKWSSIWIPVRSAAGIALLLPQASGYCLIQIFFMWLIIQGVGAADKIWGAALDYLKGGGVIIQSPIPTAKLGPGFTDKVSQAGNMLKSAICMQGLENILNRQRQANMADPLINFTDLGPVPSFLGSVNLVNTQAQFPPTQSSLSVSLPNFTGGTPYARFNGVCGSISWNRYSTEQMATIRQNLGVNEGLIQQTLQARVIGLQQMYLDLATVARTIVNNEFNAAPEARLPFGQPDGINEVWESPISSSPLLQGTELVNSALDYFRVVRPTLQAIAATAEQEAGKEFIEKARRQGWILAGSYFFDLASLSKQNEQAMTEPAGNMTAAPSPGLASGIASITAAQDAYQLNPNDVTRLNNLMMGAPDTTNDPNAQYRNINTYIAQASNFQQTGIGAAGSTSNRLSTNPLSIPMVNFDCQRMDWRPWGVNIGKASCEKILKGFTDNVVNRFMIGMVINPGLQKAGELFGNQILPIFNNFRLYINSTIDYTTQGGGTFLTDQNPLVALAKLGGDLVSAVSMIWIGGSAILLILGFFFSGLTAVMAFIGVPLGVVLMALFLLGASLAYYMPLIPYIYFTFGAIGWIIATIEAMVAAPIVAIGIAHPEGQHEIFGMGDPAVMLMLNIFLRPGMMIIGFIAAIMLSYVGLWLLNAGFAYTTQRLHMELTSFASLFSPAAVIIMYGILALLIIQKAFSLIYILPDKILRWLERGVSETLGQEAQGMAEKAEGMHKGAAGEVGRAAGGVKPMAPGEAARDAFDKNRQSKAGEKQSSALQGLLKKK